jgi:hypothetical protein
MNWPFQKQTDRTLFAAISRLKPRLVSACLSHGVSACARDVRGSALYCATNHACRNAKEADRQLEICRILLAAGADPNEPPKWQEHFWTQPLAQALRSYPNLASEDSLRCQELLVRLFLKYGFDAKTEQGGGALEFAKGKARQLLEEAGARFPAFSKNSKDYSSEVIREFVEGKCPRCGLPVKVQVQYLFFILNGNFKKLLRAWPKTKDTYEGSWGDETEPHDFCVYYCLGCNRYFRVEPELRSSRDSLRQHPFAGLQLTQLTSRDRNQEEVSFPYGCPSCNDFGEKQAQPIKLEAIPRSRRIFGHNCSGCGTLWEIFRKDDGSFSWSGLSRDTDRSLRIVELGSCGKCNRMLCRYTKVYGGDEPMQFSHCAACHNSC